MSKTFNIVDESMTAEIISAAICVPFFDTDLTQFDSFDDVAAHIVNETRDRLDTQTALLKSYGAEVTSRLNIDNMDAIKEVYGSLSPLAKQADLLVMDKLKNNDIPLFEMSAYSAATLINMFISLYVKEIIDMAREYDEEKNIESVFAREPHRAIPRLSTYIKKSCGHAARVKINQQ